MDAVVPVFHKRLPETPRTGLPTAELSLRADLPVFHSSSSSPGVSSPGASQLRAYFSPRASVSLATGPSAGARSPRDGMEFSGSQRRRMTCIHCSTPIRRRSPFRFQSGSGGHGEFGSSASPSPRRFRRFGLVRNAACCLSDSADQASLSAPSDRAADYGRAELPEYVHMALRGASTLFSKRLTVRDNAQHFR